MKHLFSIISAIFCAAIFAASPTKTQKTIILTFDDGCKSHLTFVAPILKKYNFGATFFICAPLNKKIFHDQFMTDDDILQLHKLGFEIGNHSFTHPDFRKLTDEQCREQMRKINDRFAKCGVPAPVSFAYPGGPFAANAVKILKEFNIKYARTTEKGVWDLKKTDPFRIPLAHSLKQAADMATENPDQAVVLLYHGVPDTVHPWCDTKPEIFEKQMKFLYDNNFRVLGMKQFANSQAGK